MGMVSSATATTDTTVASAAMKKSMGLNKDDFLKLFVAQLQNQDPLNPTNSDQLLAQLSSLSTVEQAYNTNTNLQSLLTAQNNTAAMSAAGLIGANIKANGNAISFDGSTPATLQFNLDAAAGAGMITITDASGKPVGSTMIGPLAAGDQAVSWNGVDSNGKTLPAGTYRFSVDATKTDGTVVTATTYTTGKVNGVSYASGSPTLTIGSTAVNLSDVISVKGV